MLVRPVGVSDSSSLVESEDVDAVVSVEVALGDVTAEADVADVALDDVALTKLARERLVEMLSPLAAISRLLNGTWNVFSPPASDSTSITAMAVPC